MSGPVQYLTPAQVRELNAKFGYFECADAQGDVSRDFAQAAIEKHERMRTAAPELLAALIDAYSIICEEVADGSYTPAAESIRELVIKVTGAPP